MELPHWAVYAALEVAAAAVILLLVLLYGSVRLARQLGNSRQLVEEKNRKIKELQDEAQLFSAAPAPVGGDYSTAMVAQLSQCRERYSQLQGVDITQDHLIATARLPLRVAALRHAYLEIEAEAAADPERCWRVLDVRLSVLLRQLCAHEAQRVVEEVVSVVAARSAAIKPELVDELQRLRAVTAEQQQQISELEARLQRASSSEEKDALLTDMQQQLNKQARYLKESETCINQLERELHTAHEQLQGAENDTGKLKDYSRELEELVGNFAAQSRDMMAAITALEKESAALRDGEPVAGNLIEGELAAGQ